MEDPEEETSFISFRRTCGGSDSELRLKAWVTPSATEVTKMRAGGGNHLRRG